MCVQVSFVCHLPYHPAPLPSYMESRNEITIDKKWMRMCIRTYFVSIAQLEYFRIIARPKGTVLPRVTKIVYDMREGVILIIMMIFIRESIHTPIREFTFIFHDTFMPYLFRSNEMCTLLANFVLFTNKSSIKWMNIY